MYGGHPCPTTLKTFGHLVANDANLSGIDLEQKKINLYKKDLLVFD
jgi:hypothetical protein